jgi:hypothetical protein
MFALPGLTGLLVARDGRWSAARYLLEAQAIAVAVILVAILRSADEIAWTSPGAWLFVVGLVSVLVAIVATALAMRRRGRTAGTALGYAS